MPWSYISELDAFEVYHQVQEELEDASDDFSFSYAFRNALAGAGATAISNVSTYPLDLVCTRLQVQSRKASDKGSGGAKEDCYDGALDAVVKIYKIEGGVSAFYNGLSSDTLKSVADAFLFFAAYNIIWRSKKMYGPEFGNPALKALDGLGVGFLAGAFTKALTTPIQNVVTRQQIQHSGKSQGAKDIVLDIYKTKGIAGFWTGYPASLLLTFNPALTFLVDAALARNFDAGEDPSALITFLLAASGKATANFLMYPLKLAKARAQVAATGQAEASTSSDKATGTTLMPQVHQVKMPSNPAAAVLHIAKTEGVNALYAGIWAEILKGFLTHGLTMMIKGLIEEELPNQMIHLALYVANLRRKYGKRKAA